MKSFELIFGYSDLFQNEIPEDPFLLLRKYSTKNILTKISYINAILYSTPLDGNKIILEKVLFGSLNLAKQYIPNLDFNLVNGHFFSSAHISTLICHTLNNYSEDQDPEIEHEKFAIDLFKTILIFNKLHSEKLKPNSKLASFESAFTIGTIQQFYIRSTSVITYLLKAAFMCNFLAEDQYLRTYAVEFCRHYGMADPWKVCKFLIELYQENQPQKGMFVIGKDSIPVNYLQDWIINKDLIDNGKKLTLNFDIIPRPLFDINETDALILDFDFFQYTIDQGFFYKIYKSVIERSDSKLKKFNNFKSYIGKKFFEEYLCNELLSKIFDHNGQFILSDDKHQDFLIKTSSDNLLVIEVKMADVHAKTIENSDFETYKKEIEENFLSQKKYDGKDKGVYQLLNQLSIITNEWDSNGVAKKLKIKSTKKLNIYPILLTSDSNYDLSGTNKYINDRVSNEINDLKSNFQSVRPILIININTLIEYFGYFRQNKFNFTNLIKSYFKEIEKYSKIYDRSKNEYNYLMASQSFNDYIQKRLIDETSVKNFDSYTDCFDFDLSNFQKPL